MNADQSQTNDLMSNPVAAIEQWQRTACPNPSTTDQCTAIGIHLEEVAEMLDALGYAHESFELSDIAHQFKSKQKKALIATASVDRVELADALMDQIYTAIGVSYRFGFDTLGAINEVIRSNNSKLVGGQFQYDKNGKVIKPEGYSLPDLTPFV